MPESITVEIGAGKTPTTLTPKEPYKGPLEVGEKYPVICRVKLEDFFDHHLMEILEINDQVIRLIIEEQQFVMPEAMVRDIIEDFPEPKIGSSLDL